MTPDVQCRWCDKPRADCPDPDLHERYHRQSEQTWRRARLAAAVLTPDDEEMDRVR